MEGHSGLSELSVIPWVSAVEGCLLSGVSLYSHCTHCTINIIVLMYSSPFPSESSHSPQIETTVGEAKKQLLGQLESYSIHAKRPRRAETVRDKHKAKIETEEL